MAKNLKTFVISKFQIQALRNLFIANGENEEAEKLNGADLAYRWKCINMDPEVIKFPKAKIEAFTKMYPFLVGYPLQEQIKPAPVKEEKAEIEQTPAPAEMQSPEAPEAPKGKNKNKKATETVA